MSYDSLAEGLRSSGIDRTAQLKMLFEKMMDGFAYHKIVVDDRGQPVDYVFLEVNNNFERMTGLKKEKIIGKRVTEVLPGIEKDPADWIGVYGRVALTGEPIQFENYAKSLDSWFQVSAYCPEKGYFVALFKDITEQKKTQQQIAKIASFPAMNPNSVVEASLSGVVEYSNPATETLFPDLKQTGVKHPFFANWENALQVLQANDKPFGRENKIGDHWYYQYFQLTQDQHVRVYSTDIDELKAAEEALRGSEQRYATTLSSIGDAVIATDIKGNVTFLNPVAETLTGWKLSEAQRKPVKTIFNIVNEQNRLEVDCPVTRVLREGLIVGLANHTVLIRKDGSEVPIDDSGAPIKDKDGNVTGVVLVFRDITERKKAENELKKMNDELEERVQQRTAQVTAERQRLYNVLETLPSYVILLNKDHRVVFANRVFRETFGESHGRRCHEYLFNKEHECEKCETYKVYKENKPQHWYWTGPNGRDYDIYDYPFKEADGSTLILEMGVDITEQKRAENLVRTTAQYSRSLIEASLDPLVTISAEGKITDVNKATEDATGVSRKELIGSDFSEYFTEPEKARIGYKKVFTDGQVVDYPLALKSKSGRIMDVLYNASVYKNEKGETQGVFAAARDITERKLVEAELAKHRDHLEELVTQRTKELWKAKNDWERTFDSVPDFIAILDNRHRILRANKAMATQLGVTPDQTVGLHCYQCVHGTSIPPEFCPHSKTVKDGKEHVEEVHEPRLGGYFLVSTTPLWDEKGNMIGSVHVARNITDRKQMQIKLEEYAAHLEELVRERTQQLKDAERLTAIGETAGMVGHDLRNPLQTLTGETYLAKIELEKLPETDAKKNIQESINTIADQISYMDKIVSDLQDFVRPIKPDKKPINIGNLLRAIVAEVKIPNTVEVETKINSNLPEVEADAQLLKRVFINLVTNAVQAMPHGGRLAIRTEHRKKNKSDKNGKVLIHVQDTGEGIPEKVKPKIFRPLFTTKSKGQGFGLAVCRRVIEAHGGSINFESKEGRGTTFTVELPI